MDGPPGRLESLRNPHLRRIIFGSGIYRCYPHHPREQFCTTCFGTGHYANVCPESNRPHCRNCAQITHLAQEHECMSCCPNCNRDHPADDPDCKVRRTTDKAVWQAVYLKELQLGEEEERSAAQDKPKKVTIEDPSTSQSRSKSRSKSQIEPRMKVQHVS
ncbi:hypothetical protein HPB49_008131 [Dermacentor silvarum]|uniref:Uncharacterized protein n=1 Tax=Dermacentor silvarum TaxID=543639 RepID=A0ACB8DNE1_DERSI|nr:hypothetical protein HPB49_008131 [Dermacentor silvarum]